LRFHHLFIPLAIAVMAIAAVVNPSVAFIAGMSCLGMVGCDFFGTFMNVAENRGQDVMAGYGDMGSDFFGKYLLAGWSGSTLTHGHSWIGWVAIWPVLVTGFYTTGFATRWAQRIKVDDGTNSELP
jgi:hypothetical protein